MATIEERAIKLADNMKRQTYFDDRVKDVAGNIAYESYIIGATDYIEKACECFRQELKHFAHMLDWIKGGSGEIIDVEGSIDSFRKTMEE